MFEKLLETFMLLLLTIYSSLYLLTNDSVSPLWFRIIGAIAAIGVGIILFISYYKK